MYKNSNGDTYADSNANANADSNTDEDTDLNADADADAYSNAVVDTASWHMRLDELLCHEGGGASYHKAQSSVIGKRLDDAQKRVKDVAARVQIIGVGGAIAETPHHY